MEVFVVGCVGGEVGGRLYVEARNYAGRNMCKECSMTSHISTCSREIWGKFF